MRILIFVLVCLFSSTLVLAKTCKLTDDGKGTICMSDYENESGMEAGTGSINN